MKVFISWSGDRSLKVAELLRDWIRCVLQPARPWISSQNLERGSIWFSEIGDQLRDTSVGIICLTSENRDRPWILFEAGALAKGLSTSRVCPFLIDIESAHVGDPLAQFNHTLPNRGSMMKLVVTLNSGLGEQALDQQILEKVFETYWPQFEAEFQNVLTSTPETQPVVINPTDLLSELISSVRSLGSRITNMEESVRTSGTSKAAARLLPFNKGTRIEKWAIPAELYTSAEGGEIARLFREAVAQNENISHSDDQ